MDTPATLTATIDNGGSSATSGTGSSGILSSTANNRRISIVSTDWSDIGTHKFILKCYFTNYPTIVDEAIVTITVNDCDSSCTSHCPCAWLKFTTDFSNWGTTEWVKSAD
jgi:hypothetical protein